jgi:NadR type nicotinamide-nucleotide adenylyltransferase
MALFKKIVTIGPESTGKSTLCQQLAAHYNTIWCAEYAREYLLKHGTDYSFDDLLTIAKGQLRIEDEAIATLPAATPEAPPPLFFVDTDMYVMKVWCEFVFGKCHNWIIRRLVERPADLYLLCHTDLPWTKDELREYPDDKIRHTLFHYYKDIAINSGVPWVNVTGSREKRTQSAIDGIDALLAAKFAPVAM